MIVIGCICVETAKPSMTLVFPTVKLLVDITCNTITYLGRDVTLSSVMQPAQLLTL